MDLPQELIELFTAFGSANTEFLLVGGHAVAVHGRPRATKDVDLWLRPGAENIERACQSLHSFGIPADLVDALRRAKPDEIVWFGRAPMRIDLLQTLPGVDFESAWARRVQVEVGGAAIRVVAGGSASILAQADYASEHHPHRGGRGHLDAGARVCYQGCVCTRQLSASIHRLLRIGLVGAHHSDRSC